MLEIKNASTSNATVTWTTTPKPQTEIAKINAQLDELAGPIVKRCEPGQVDAFVVAVRQQLVEESLSKARQAHWEDTMNVHAHDMTEITPEDERVRDAERLRLEEQHRAERDAVRQREFEEREAADAERRRSAQESGTVFGW